jgi:hypothetical protein
MGCDYNIDEVCLTINGERCYLWRAVDQDSNILDILVQLRYSGAAPPQYSRGQEVFPQVAQRVDVRPAGDCDG